MWTPSRRTSTGWGMTGTTGSTMPPTTLRLCTGGRGAHREGPGLRLRADPEQMKEMRGDLTHPRTSPYRDRPKEETPGPVPPDAGGRVPPMAMFTLRAKIDPGLRQLQHADPFIYRINHAKPSPPGDKWCIYPMYDSAHPLRDAMGASSLPVLSGVLRTTAPSTGSSRTSPCLPSPVR